MELDDIKNSWNQPREAISHSDKIQDMINKPSHGPVARMKRNLAFELVSVIVGFGFIAVYYFTAFKSEFSIVGWVYLILIVLFGLYFFQKNKLLNQVQCSTCHVRSNLELQVKMLEKYTRFYLFCGTIVVPILMLFFGILFYYTAPDLINRTILYPSESNPTWKVIIAWFILLSASTAILFLLNRAYVNRLYGRHIQRLKQLLAQIKE